MEVICCVTSGHVTQSIQSKPESIVLPCLLQFLSPGSCWLPSVMGTICHVKLSLPKMVFYHNRNSKSPLISKYSWKSKIYQHKQFKVIKDTQYIHERSSLFLKNKIYQFVIKTNTCSLEARSHSVVLQSHSDDLASVFQVLRHGPEPIAQQLSPWSFFKATFLFFKAPFLSNHDKLLQVLN